MPLFFNYDPSSREGCDAVLAGWHNFCFSIGSGGIEHLNQQTYNKKCIESMVKSGRPHGCKYLGSLYHKLWISLEAPELLKDLAVFHTDSFHSWTYHRSKPRLGIWRDSWNN